MYFQVRLGVVRSDTDASVQSLSDNLAARERLLQAQLDAIQELVVEPQPGFATTSTPGPSIIVQNPVHLPSIVQDDDDEEDAAGDVAADEAAEEEEEEEEEEDGSGPDF